MVTMWTHLSTMPHSGLYLNQVATVPGACKVEPTVSQLIVPPIKQVRVRNLASSSTSNSTTVRTSCNPRSQSSVIDAEPVVEPSCWRVDPSFLVAEELPGWENVTAKSSTPSVEEPSKEVHSRTFRENVQDNVERSSTSEGSFLGDSDEEASTTSRSSRHGQNKQRSFYSRPDMIRWRLVVEGVRNPIDEEHDPNRNFRASQHLQDVILFLESLGLNSSKMMAKYPSLSTCSVENIRAVVKFLESNKLRRRDVVKILNNNPFLLGHSVEANFLPVVTFLLTEVGLQEKDIGKVINRCARMLTVSVENQLRPTLRFLQALGFNHMSVVVSNNATLLASSVENRLIPKMEFLIGLGLSKEEAVQALIRFPAIFNYSIEKNLQPKFRYLVEDMGRGLADLRAFPQFFGYSLEHRIRPRYLFLKKRNLSLPLADLLKPTDEVFYARFQHEKLMQEKEPSYMGTSEGTGNPDENALVWTHLKRYVWFWGESRRNLKGNNCGLHCWIVGEERWQGRAMDYAASFFEGRGAHWNYNSLKKFDAITTPVQHHLCKVYSTLTATVLLSAVGVYIHTVWNIGGIITSLLFFGASTWLAVMPATVENESKRLQLLSAAALCEGASVGTLVGQVLKFNPSIVTVAFLGSTAIFACFTGAALLAKRREYLFWGGVLSSAISMMLLMQFGSIFLGGGRFLFNLELYLGLAVFVGYVLFDTQMIIERASLGDYDYIKHALDLFIDFVAIFVRILIILVQKTFNRNNDNDREYEYEDE